MKRLVLGLAFLAAFLPQQAAANHLVWLPGLHTPVLNRVLERGFVTYRLDTQAAAYPGFAGQAADVVLAATGKHGVPAYSVSSAPDVWLTMPSDAHFVNVCTPQAAACVLYWADPIIVLFRRSLLHTDWRSALAHEGINGGHVFGLHERYIDSGGQIQCDPAATYTTMSCVTGVWRLTDWDRDRIFNALVPDAPSQVWLTVADGWAVVHWNDLREDGGTAGLYNDSRNLSARYVAFARSVGDGAPVWVGEIMGPFTSRFADYERGFDAWWQGSCLWLRAENTATWPIPQISSSWWTLAGCWP